ncbi:uncharacterized protein LOC110693155 [Chenopodium quinoa]|uniref:uncharacterized protein LOC110693155 n=1 Tax=Chenopodium quinoa TaxID=63459 RepID=UPI000B78AD24|nr:uncharacterized protein LOC110693155 [Chenopodium quinoa]
MDLDKKTGRDVLRRILDQHELGANIGSETMPLLEVFSVSVNTSLPGMFLDDCDCCEIYGTIKATNGLGHVFDLYKRKRNNPEFIEPNRDGYTRYLSLTGLKDGRVIIPYDYVVMEVDPRDRARSDVVIAKGKLSFNYKETFYTEHGAEIVLGEAGFVTLHYATFPYAVTASVDVFFFSKDGDYDVLDYDCDVDVDYTDYDTSAYGNDDGVDVYGTVVAQTNFPGSVSYGTISSILLKLSRDECVRVKSRSSIELSRSMVAMPVNSNSPLKYMWISSIRMEAD